MILSSIQSHDKHISLTLVHDKLHQFLGDECDFHDEQEDEADKQDGHILLEYQGLMIKNGLDYLISKKIVL